MENCFGRFGYGDYPLSYSYWPPPAFSSSPSAQPSNSAAIFPPNDLRNSWGYYQHSSPDWSSLTDDYYASMNSSSHNTHRYQSGVYSHNGENSSNDVSSSHGGFKPIRAVQSSDYVSHPHWSTCDWRHVNSGPTSSEEVKSHEPVSKSLEQPSIVHVSNNGGFEDSWGKLHSPYNYGDIRNVDLNLDPSKCVKTPENVIKVLHSSLNDSSKDRSFIIRPKKLNLEMDLNRKESGSVPVNNENAASEVRKAAKALRDSYLRGKISAVVDGIKNLSEELVDECFNNGNSLKSEQFESLEKVVENLSKCLRKWNLNKTKEVETINVKTLPEDWSTSQEVKHKNEMTQSIKNVLVSKFSDEKEVEENSQAQMFKHLWLEAEAALCSTNLIARYHLVKNEHDDHVLLDKEISEEAKNGEKNVEESGTGSNGSDIDSVIFTAGLQTDSDTESETYSESDEEEDSIIDECNEETEEDKVSTENSSDLDSPISTWEHV